jgi:hypothetical protein
LKLLKIFLLFFFNFSKFILPKLILSRCIIPKIN